MLIYQTLFKVEGRLSSLANPLNPKRMESILREAVDLEAKQEEECVPINIQEDDVSIYFYGDQEPCKCTPRSTCSTNYCIFTKTGLKCIDLCHNEKSKCNSK